MLSDPLDTDIKLPLFIRLSVIYPLAIIGHAESTVVKTWDSDQFLFLSHAFILLSGCRSSDLPSLPGGPVHSSGGMQFDLRRLSTHLPCYSEYLVQWLYIGPPDFWRCISLLLMKPVQQATCWPSIIISAVQVVLPPELALTWLWMSETLASESSELSGSLIVSVMLPASICQVIFLVRVAVSVGWSWGGVDPEKQPLWG